MAFFNGTKASSPIFQGDPARNSLPAGHIPGPHAELVLTRVKGPGKTRDDGLFLPGVDLGQKSVEAGRLGILPVKSAVRTQMIIIPGLPGIGALGALSLPPKNRPPRPVGVSARNHIVEFTPFRMSIQHPKIPPCRKPTVEMSGSM